ncbi:MAG: 4-hydroxythreonine-4-phosphate dehydrogenase PdxA [Pseudomonadaceae bacterium]|nr:4-hydroxythreonine-4-phosphate dehydrogenase PdxA [Pseudomonadaceae bacterium]
MLLISAGEPAGVGPDVVLANASVLAADSVVLADIDVLAQRAKLLNLDVPLVESTRPAANGKLAVWHHRAPAPVSPGVLDPANARYVIDCLTSAADACVADSSNALVTAPIHKATIGNGGIEFSGHTEYLRDHAKALDVVMLLATDALRVALATTHLPLRAVPDAITQELLERRLGILANALTEQFGISRPNIAVCGLNPHAGESGHMGREEIDVIEPACRALRARGIQVSDPMPADTVFVEHNLEGVDAVFAMYHDQGLPVLKHAGFGGAVNVTLGLPYVRTSVDHGTAVDIAATGQVDSGSFLASIQLARRLLRIGSNARS